jgi:hypothetical protein
MTGVQILIARTALSVVASLAGVVLASSPRIHRSLPHVFDRTVTAALLSSRLCFFFFLFFILKFPVRGDVPAYYMPGAKAVLAGLLPYRDFDTSYGPLHGYLDAVILTLWNSPLAIVLFAILIEGLLLPIWLRLGRSFIAERDLRIACALYLTSPLSLVFVTIDGQNTIIIAVLLALSLLWITRNRNFFSGILVGASIVIVKFLPLLYVPAYLLSLPRRWRWLAGFTAVVIAGEASFVFLHAPVLQPFRVEGNLRTSGNIPYFIETVLGIALPGHLWDAVMLCALAAAIGRIGFATRRSVSPVNLRTLAFALVALTLTLLLFSKKAFPAYLMLVLFPLYLLFPHAGRIRLIILACFTTAAIIEPSLWYTLLFVSGSVDLHRKVLLHQPAALLFLAVQVVLLAGYGWLLSGTLRQLNEAPGPVNPQPDLPSVATQS